MFGDPVSVMAAVKADVAEVKRCHGTVASVDSGSATRVDVLDPRLVGMVEVVIAYEGSGGVSPRAQLRGTHARLRSTIRWFRHQSWLATDHTEGTFRITAIRAVAMNPEPDLLGALVSSRPDHPDPATSSEIR